MAEARKLGISVHELTAMIGSWEEQR
jgi:GntR family transcriptional regulator